VFDQRLDARGAVRVQVMLNGFEAILEHALTFRAFGLRG
jgi:hypothetical protein